MDSFVAFNICSRRPFTFSCYKGELVFHTETNLFAYRVIVNINCKKKKKKNS